MYSWLKALEVYLRQTVHVLIIDYFVTVIVRSEKRLDEYCIAYVIPINCCTLAQMDFRIWVGHPF